jgi:hypothetical protein
MLISALINEAFARVLVLKQFAFAHSPHAATTLATNAVRQTQLVWQILWLAAAIYAAVKVVGGRKPPARTIGYPMRYTGGVFLTCVGAGIAFAGLLGGTALTWGFLAGLALGITLARRMAPQVRSRWGLPGIRQGQAVAFAVALEIAAFNVMGASGVFVALGRTAAWEAGLAIVGAHFLLMRWSHGPWIAVLGAAVLAWLGLGIAAHLPLAAIAVGDGLLKMAFGLIMAWPLVRPQPTVPAAP